VNSIDRSINISIKGDNSSAVVVDKDIAQKILNNAPVALDQIEYIEKPALENILEKNNMALRFKQIEKEEKNNRNTKGIIDEINTKSFPVMFAEGLKNTIIYGNPNPLKYIYLVDVKINKIDNKIQSYTVLKINDSYISETEEQTENVLF
jgi:hypothetical protein